MSAMIFFVPENAWLDLNVGCLVSTRNYDDDNKN